MTIITVRNGIMAVDSAVTDVGVVIGSILKHNRVRDEYGGGWVGGAGGLAVVSPALSDFGLHGTTPTTDCNLLHLMTDGSVWRYDGEGAFYHHEAPFYAIGCGREIARGAMMHGATAEEAAKYACESTAGCGGKVHVLKV